MRASGHGAEIDGDEMHGASLLVTGRAGKAKPDLGMQPRKADEIEE